MAAIETAPRTTLVTFLVTAVLGGVMGGCPSSSDARDASAGTPVASGSGVVDAAAVAPAWEGPPREGCARTGELEGLESDATCVVARADEALTRESMKDVSLVLAPDRPSIVSGGTMLVRLTLTNRGKSDADLVFVAQPASATSKPDWTRLAGVPELRPGAEGGHRILMPMRTMDAHDRGVDGLPTTPQTSSPTARLLRVRLKPGGKLTHAFPFWALRIPPPMPIYYDDAGHRFVPKTAPVNLPPGEYNVAIDVPLLGVSPAEAAATTRVVVEKVEKLDGAAPPPMVDPPF